VSSTTERAQLAADIADFLGSSGLTVAVAESLTGGMVSSALAEAPGSSAWFCGALVAYTNKVKHELLHVPPGPVVTADAAAVMANEVRRLLGADVSVSLTGAAGPDSQDGQPPGTVFVGLSDGRHTHVEHRHFGGEDPSEVCTRTTAEALRLLLDYLSGSGPRPGQRVEPGTASP
jgi:nicotinamide-nucleotide amidase